MLFDSSNSLDVNDLGRAYIAGQNSAIFDDNSKQPLQIEREKELFNSQIN